MRAIYDALDSQNYKTAINLCNKLLKKHDSPSVQSLKALALSRSGSSKQALEIALKIKQLMPIDPHLLYSLTLTLKSLLRFQDIADLYQNAFTHYPTAEYAQLWFLSLVRLGDYKLIQQVAFFNLGCIQTLKIIWLLSRVGYCLCLHAACCCLSRTNTSKSRIAPPR
jgi:tetratricopeptide (TPR) repeat protein